MHRSLSGSTKASDCVAPVCLQKLGLLLKDSDTPIGQTVNIR